MGTDAFQIRRHNNINVQDSVHPYRGYTQNQLVATVNTNAGNVKEDINIGDSEAKANISLTMANIKVQSSTAVIVSWLYYYHLVHPNDVGTCINDETFWKWQFYIIQIAAIDVNVCKHQGTPTHNQN